MQVSYTQPINNVASAAQQKISIVLEHTVAKAIGR